MGLGLGLGIPGTVSFPLPPSASPICAQSGHRADAHHVLVDRWKDA